MHCIPEHAKRTFHQAIPQGWQVESIVYMPVPGWDCDLYVCRISDGINTRYLTTDHGRVSEASKKDIQARLKEYQRMHEAGLAWLEGSA